MLSRSLSKHADRFLASKRWEAHGTGCQQPSQKAEKEEKSEIRKWSYWASGIYHQLVKKQRERENEENTQSKGNGRVYSPKEKTSVASWQFSIPEDPARIHFCEVSLNYFNNNKTLLWVILKWGNLTTLPLPGNRSQHQQWKVMLIAQNLGMMWWWQCFMSVFLLPKHITPVKV